MNDNINDAQETINPTMTEPFRWLHFLPRWSLIVALATLALAIVFMVGLGQHTSDNTLGAEYTELLQAVRIPGIFRALWTIDALIWLMLGVILIALALRLLAGSLVN